MKTNNSFLAFMMLLTLTACHSKVPTTAIVSVDIRALMANPSTLPLADEIEHVAYIPLEVSTSDESLVGSLIDYALTDSAIYLLPYEEGSGRVLQFNRQGKFITKLISYGQGPNDFNGSIIGIHADQQANRLYLFGTGMTWEYTLQGECIRKTVKRQNIIEEQIIDTDRFAFVSMPYFMAFSDSVGIGITNAKGERLAMKHDFYLPSLPRDKTGFTTNFAVSFSDGYKSMLFKVGSNDTIFRLSGDRIAPLCAFRLGNSEQEIRQAVDISEFPDNFEALPHNRDIRVNDMFETPTRIYFRLFGSREAYVLSLDKQNNDVKLESCITNKLPLSDLVKNDWKSIIGTSSYHHFPVWGRTFGKLLVQIITPAEINACRNISGVTIPNALNNMDEEANPVVVIYDLKSK